MTKGFGNREGDWPQCVFRETLEHFLVRGGRGKPLLWLLVGLGQDYQYCRALPGLLWAKRRKNYKGKIIESTGLPNIEKVNPDNSPSSDEHRGGTWQEKRCCYCQKSLSVFSGLFFPALPSDWGDDSPQWWANASHFQRSHAKQAACCLSLPLAMQDEFPVAAPLPIYLPVAVATKNLLMVKRKEQEPSTVGTPVSKPVTTSSL